MIAKRMIYSVLIISCIVLLSAAAGYSEGLNAKIIYLEGTVTVNKGPASVGMEVNQGDEIVTGNKSVCDIEFAPYTYSRIGEKTETVLETSQIETKKTLFGKKKMKKIRLDIKKGAVLSKLKKLRGKDLFEVKTPVAVVGVRGTIFSTQTGSSGTNVSVFQGSVSVTNTISGAVAKVSAGQSLSVSAESGESSSADLSAAEIDSMKSVTGVTQTSAEISTPKIKTTELLLNTTSTPVDKYNKPTSVTNNVTINFSR